MNPLVTHLESAWTGERFAPGPLYSTHADRPLWVRYDLPAVARTVKRGELQQRPPGLWRYRELLPHAPGEPVVSLGESATPLLECTRLAARFNLRQLLVKDESQLPTGSFKSRGMALALTLARQLGVRRVALPTAGNAGGAAAAYAARAGLECFVFMPDDTPAVNQYECRLAGAHTFLVNGLIGDCGRLVAQGTAACGWFNLATLREPYRLEGKKTMGLELADQLGWKLPNVILYPTGGGTGLIGMWKAFQELQALGWLENDKLPRMVAVQSSGCAPIVQAFEARQKTAVPFANAQTVASGLRVPSAIGDFMILEAVRASGGLALAVDEARILDWMRSGAAAEGIPFCPEAAACLGALESLTASGWIGPDESVVLFNTGAAQKYVEALRAELPRINLSQPLDYEALLRKAAGPAG